MSWMIWPKGCKRCGGDLSMEGDVYGTYVACLQCGQVLGRSAVERRIIHPGGGVLQRRVRGLVAYGTARGEYADQYRPG